MLLHIPISVKGALCSHGSGFGKCKAVNGLCLWRFLMIYIQSLGGRPHTPVLVLVRPLNVGTHQSYILNYEEHGSICLQVIDIYSFLD